MDMNETFLKAVNEMCADMSPTEAEEWARTRLPRVKTKPFALLLKQMQDRE